jgi:predicted ester cyclase
MFARISTVLLVGFLLVALGGVFQATTAQTEANKAIVLRVAELWNTGDLSIADEVFATDFVPHVPHYPLLIDLESYRAQVVIDRSRISDIRLEVQDVVAEGERVACRFCVTGTGMGVQYTNAGINMDRLAGGKIVEEWWNHDMLGVMEQLGPVPPTREDYTWGTPSEVTGDPGDPAANKERVEDVMSEVLNNQNLPALDEIMATDIVWHDPGSDIVGVEAVQQKFAGNFVAFPDLHVTVDDIIAEGDKVAARWTLTGTHEGTGVQVAVPGMVIHRLADGKIVESWHITDSLGMMQQLGVIPALPDDPLGFLPITAVESGTWGQVKSLFQE